MRCLRCNVPLDNPKDEYCDRCEIDFTIISVAEEFGTPIKPGDLNFDPELFDDEEDEEDSDDED